MLMPLGKGFPEFSGEDSCTYIFDWSTDLACIAPPLECQLTSDGAKYDLSRLIRSDGSGQFHFVLQVLASLYVSNQD